MFLIVLSPAKSLDFSSAVSAGSLGMMSQPVLEDQAELLAQALAPLSADHLSELMGLSPKLAELNADRFKAWRPKAQHPEARPAVLTFNGDVYEGLNAATLTAEQLKWAQSHLRILSGLYGVLRPLDALQAYRLEMGTRFLTARGKDLYSFWGHRITAALNEAIQALQGSKSRSKEAVVLVNLASEEYFKAVQLRPQTPTPQDPGGPGLSAPVISPVFQDYKQGGYKVVSFYAKRARGLMARFIIENRLDQPSDLTQFRAEGYEFDLSASTPDRPVFRRP